LATSFLLTHPLSCLCVSVCAVRNACPPAVLLQTDFPERFSFPGAEKDVLELWEKLDAFKTSLRLSEGKPRFTFYGMKTYRS
jgi:hypothetical protein